MSDWKKYKTALDITGLVLLLAIVFNLYTKEEFNTDNYFIVDRVFVEDHGPFEDPRVVYDRQVMQPFVGEWFAKVYDVDNVGGNRIVVCQGTKRHNYNPEDVVVDRTLSWYLGVECALPTGKYMVRTLWEIEGRGKVRETSNVWTVAPLGFS